MAFSAIKQFDAPHANVRKEEAIRDGVAGKWCHLIFEVIIFDSNSLKDFFFCFVAITEKLFGNIEERRHDPCDTIETPKHQRSYDKKL